MLFDEEILRLLHQKLGTKYSNFDIHVFLQILQSTTRRMGYPDYRNGVDNCHYINDLRNKIEDAIYTRNANVLCVLMESIYQIMVCFCYFQETVCLIGIDEELVELLYTAVNAREDSTDEERCAEQSLLAMILQKPKQILNLFSEYQESMRLFNIQELLEKQIGDYERKYLKHLLENIPMDCSLEATNEILSSRLATFRKAEMSLSTLTSYEENRRLKCQSVIGAFLLEFFKDALNEDWIMSSDFLKNSLTYAIRDRGKKEILQYIAQRESEDDILGFFKIHPKKTKLCAAKKFYAVLSNRRGISFFPDERDALQNDHGSRLTDIFERYKSDLIL